MTRRPGGLILASLLAASCAAPPSSQAPATGTLSLSLAGLFPAERQVQVLPAGKQAKVTVTGPGLAQPLTVTAPIHGTSLMATLRGIPAGPNRVIELEAQDEGGAPIAGGRYRTTATLQAGANTAVISPITTPRGDIFAKLLADGSPLAKTLDAVDVQATVEAIQKAQRVPHFGLIDGEAIAQALLTNGGKLDALLATEAAFVQQAVTLRVTISGLPHNVPAEVWLDDPVSPTQTSVSNGGLDITPIKPGVWRLHGRAGTLRVGPVELDLTASKTATMDFATALSAAPSLPHGRGGAAAAVLPLGGSQRLIVAGGIAGTGPSPQATRSVLAFDGENWETLPGQMGLAVSHAAIATRGDQLWVLGGITQAGQLSNAVQVFDASEGSWTTLDWTLPFPSSLASAAFFGDALYLTAGMEDWGGSGGPNWTVYRIKPETGAMEYTGQRLAYSRYGAATAVADGKLFVFSGIDDYGDLIHAVEVFDPAKGTVTGTAPIPTPRFGATAWVTGSKILVIGGVGRNGKAMATIEAFDLATNRWEAHAPLRTPRGYLAGGFLAGAFVAAGGHDGFHTSVSTSVSPFDVVESLAQ
jgi:hypothetical protein